MRSEHRCRKAEVLCARLSEKDAKNEDAGQTGLKKITEEKRRNRKRKKESRMRKKHDKKEGMNKSSKEAHISCIYGEMTEENRISQK